MSVQARVRAGLLGRSSARRGAMRRPVEGDIRGTEFARTRHHRAPELRLTTAPKRCVSTVIRTCRQADVMRYWPASSSRMKSSMKRSTWARS